MVDWEAFYGAFRQPGFVPGYEILNHLGGGAFGEVYKARKVSIGKPYAIKFLKVGEPVDESGTPDGGDGAERELEQVRHFASIDHPNLVTIEDVGAVMGVPYLVMGYAGEDTLARHIQARDIDQESALRIFVQIARGVLALHDRKLAHFDLKPSNVFLNGDVARVGDYGLAKLLTDGRQTLSYGRGTPQYMAPEMLRNRADHRADIYSLGVVLYESLTFALPFAPDRDLGVFVREDDLPPSFPDGFPERIVRVVTRCLRLDPGDRYPTVEHLLGDLGQSAHQGDSIVVGQGGAAAMPPPLPPPDGAEHAAGVPASTGDASSRPDRAGRPGSELRTAAAELARGALGVAAGAWEGVRGRSARRTTARREDRAPDASGPDPAARRDGTPFPPLRDPLPPPPAPPPAAGAAARPEDPGLGADVVSVATLDGDPPDAPDAPPVEESGWPPAPLEERGTIPVPPRAEGGLLGTVVGTATLGAEMLGVLVTAPARLVSRSLGRRADHAARRLPGILGALVRTAFFVLGMAALGGLVALVLLAVFFTIA